MVGEFDEKQVGLIVPTCNPGEVWNRWIRAFGEQTFRPAHLLIIDSSSTDKTVQIAQTAGFQTKIISWHEFNHGASRQMACTIVPVAEYLVFLTQDAFLATPESLEKIIQVFADPQVGAAFGRQLPRYEADLIESHARFFNYPPRARMNSAADIEKLGIKAAFISNSFAAYRRLALEDVGGFPDRCIVSEDTYVAAKMILAGWKIAYCADAQVYHSHNYNWRQEFQRYFDIGVFHAREPWVREKFGGAEGEGRRFFMSEMKFLLNRAPHLLLSACLRTVIKYLGFRIGLVEKYLPLGLKRRLSMQKSFWRTKDMESSDA